MRKTLLPAAAAAALVAGLLGPMAGGADAAKPPAGCARQEAQVAKAQQAYDRLQAVFAKQKHRVADAVDAVEAADTQAEEQDATEALHQAKVKVAKTKKLKKAQAQRLAKAQRRLDNCQAQQPSTGGDTGTSDPATDPTA